MRKRLQISEPIINNLAIYKTIHKISWIASDVRAIRGADVNTDMLTRLKENQN